MPENNKNNQVDSVEVNAIGFIESPYQEKFAIPRQPGLVSAARGKIFLTNEHNHQDLVKDIEQFSHLWLVFIFHETQNQGWKPLVRPPRLGGNVKTGVLATRSTFRPNPIGMSVVKLERVELAKLAGKSQVILHISGADLVNNTPIIDIKPYLPYSDAITEASAGFAQTEPANALQIQFSKQASTQLNHYSAQYPNITQLIEQVLAQDPRPAYKHGKIDTKDYGMSLYDLNIQWKMVDLSTIEVFNITKS